MKLPYFKKRYYLSGIDWIISAIDYYMQKTSSAGNHSTLFIELNEPLDEAVFKSRLEEIFSLLPILNAWLGRDIFNLAPYWKISKKNQILPVIKTEYCDTPDDLSRIKNQTMNTGFRSLRDHQFFTIITGKLQNALLMTFDHKLLDARGAEIFLNLLTSDHGKFEEIIRKIKTTESPKLKDWNKKFAAGRDVQRHFMKLSQKKYISMSKHSIKAPPAKGQTELASVTVRFSEIETSSIRESAEKKAGYMMETPYLLAIAAFAIHSVVAPEQDANYSVPMPIDMRKAGTELQRMLFNHLSFMFLDIRIGKTSKLEEIICEVRNSIFHNIENELPEKLLKATRLSRISPLPFLKHFMKLPLDGQVASFAFANVGESPEPVSDILANKIKGIYHLPRIPTPPGIGIFFNRSYDVMNFSITWDKSSVEKDIVLKIMAKIKECIYN